MYSQYTYSITMYSQLYIQYNYVFTIYIQYKWNDQLHLFTSMHTCVYSWDIINTRHSGMYYKLCMYKLRLIQCAHIIFYQVFQTPLLVLSY